MNRIDCVVVEEHHEILPVWREGLRRGLGLTGASIVHLDEHSDLGLPEMSRPLPALSEGWEADWRFVHEELNIGNFLIAGLSSGEFPALWWHRCGRTRGEQRRYYVTCTDNGRLMRLEPADSDVVRADNQRLMAQFEYHQCTDLSTVTPTGAFILDICLDYFASHITPQRGPVVLEVTEDCWQAFVNDPYHPFRLYPGARVRATRTFAGIAALQFEPTAIFGDRTTLSYPLEWQLRIEAVSQWLARYGSACVLVGISRSARSGYTPAALVEDIEASLARVLHERLGAKVQFVSDWLQEH